MGVPEITSLVLERWDSFFPLQKRPSDLRYIAIPASVEGGTVTFLGFGPRGSNPLFTAKLHRMPDAGDRARREAEVLRSIEPTDLGPTVPRVLTCDRFGGHWVVIESILRGTPMSADVVLRESERLARMRRHVESASRWLARLFAVTRHPAPEQRVDVAEEFATIFAPSEDARSLARRAASIVSRYPDRCVQHNDFIKENVLVGRRPAGSHLSVIDWSDSKPHGLPLHDLVFFLALYGSHRRAATDDRGIREEFTATFFGTSDEARLVQNILLAQARRTGVAGQDIGAHVAVALMEQAVFEYRKMTRHSKYGPLPKSTMTFATYHGETPYADMLKRGLWAPYFVAFADAQRRGEAGPLSLPGT